MEFTVYRTSRGLWYDIPKEEPPCKGATPRTYKDGDTYWVINIDTLEDLLAFVKEHGEIVLEHEQHATLGMHSIEIYDGYR